MDTQETIGTLIDKSKDFLETKIEIARLKTISKSADILSTVVVMVSMLFIGTLVIILLSIGLALFLGSLMGSNHDGFFAVGGFYAIILLVLYTQRHRWIKTPISRELINKMLK